MRRSVGYELFAMGTVLAISLATVLVFPMTAVGFRAAPTSADRSAGAAFVLLSEAREKASLAAAKASWQGGLGVRRLRTNLAVGDLPEEVVRPVLERRERPAATEAEEVRYAPGAFAPSSAAARPTRIGAEQPVSAPPAFPREELLKID